LISLDFQCLFTIFDCGFPDRRLCPCVLSAFLAFLSMFLLCCCLLVVKVSPKSWRPLTDTHTRTHKTRRTHTSKGNAKTSQDLPARRSSQHKVSEPTDKSRGFWFVNVCFAGLPAFRKRAAGL